MAAMFDCRVEQIVGADAVGFSTRPAQEVGDYLASAVAAGGEPVTTDWATHSLTGRPLHLALSSRLLAGRAGSAEVLVNVVDVSERRRAQEHLTHLAATDALTGLPNRRRFTEVLDRHLDRAPRTGRTGPAPPRPRPLQGGQRHARPRRRRPADPLGGRRAERASASDTVARLGGDEFAILLPDADDAAAAVVAATVVERVREHCAALDGAQRQVTTSVGVASFVAAAERGADATDLADELMYDAKAAGRDGWAQVDAAGERHGSATSGTAPRRALVRAAQPDLGEVVPGR